MMDYSVFDDCTWLFPDTPLSGARAARLDAPRGGHAGFQLLAAPPAEGGPVHVSFAWSAPGGPAVQIYELLPVVVNENTAPTLMTTTDYALCRDYVTRKAPFEVYDALSPCCGGICAGRAFYLSAEVSAQQAPGLYTGVFRLACGGEELACPVSCRVYDVCVPDLGSARLGMLNFFCYENIAAQHPGAEGRQAQRRLLRAYIRAQLEMRCTHILLPPGRPVYQNGRLAGFDFSAAEQAGRIALEAGAPWLCGGHIAHWAEWTGAEYYPFWDESTGVTTLEGYFQLRLYFSSWARVIRQNGWQGRIAQALADEPQVHNTAAYRILAAVCRKFLPGVPILDAVEAAELGGGLDIWVPKLDTYEKHREIFDRLKGAGETMWFYTCAFPAGRAMNRSMDLPLTVSRAVLWMAALYRLSGYLHWGFNYYIGQDIWHSACCPHKGALLPAGDAHIVYPGAHGPLRSMRFEAQRGGAEDCELLFQLMDGSQEEAEDLIRPVCTSSCSYTPEGEVLLRARRQLMADLERRAGPGAPGKRQ